jgi:TRAP-type C4-dicarboxylate transport system substrate-binding protein
MNPRWHSTVVAVAALAAAGLSGCWSGGGDKAGGSGSPVVLRLAAPDRGPRPAVEQPDYFAQQVHHLSHGAMRVEIVPAAAGLDVEDPEIRVARMVRDGRFELGWIGARAWDTLGIEAFQALQAPFLITDKALLDTVVSGEIGKGMLARLHGQGVRGIALVPGLLRHPFGVNRPFTSLKDFAGARVRVNPSRASDALVRALGARPVHVSGEKVGTVASRGGIDVREQSLGADPVGTWLSANVTFFGKANTLFGNASALDRLTDDQRDILRRAGARMVQHAIDAAPFEDELVLDYCTAARVVVAAEGDLMALRRATRPVYAQLERDPATKMAIAAIRKVKATLPLAPVADVPAECSEPVRASARRPRDPSLVDGTYRWRLTAAGLRRSGASDADTTIGTVSTMTLRDGRWLLGGEDHDHGTFEIRGNRLIFDWPRTNSVLTFTFARHRDGTLDVTPVLPMDQGDQYVWASGPWRRVGPPVRRIPDP